MQFALCEFPEMAFINILYISFELVGFCEHTFDGKLRRKSQMAISIDFLLIFQQCRQVLLLRRRILSVIWGIICSQLNGQLILFRGFHRFMQQCVNIGHHAAMHQHPHLCSSSTRSILVWRIDCWHWPSQVLARSTLY